MPSQQRYFDSQLRHRQRSFFHLCIKSIMKNQMRQIPQRHIYISTLTNNPNHQPSPQIFQLFQFPVLKIPLNLYFLQKNQKIIRMSFMMMIFISDESQCIHYNKYKLLLCYDIRVQIFINYKINLMSSKKIIRLKTPLKLRQETPTPIQQSFPTAQFNQQSTILLVKNVACSQQLQITLINQINKIYKQLSKSKKQLQSIKCKNDEIIIQNEQLRRLMVMLQQDYKMMKQMYVLQRQNHDSLRRFYQERQKQWVSIVEHHKLILEQYRQFNEQSYDDYQNINKSHIYHQNHSQIFQVKQNSLNQANKQQPSLNTGISHHNSRINTSSSIQRKLRSSLKQSSIERRRNIVRGLSSRSKDQYEGIQRTGRAKAQKDDRFIKSMSRLYSKESKFAEQSIKQYRNVQKSYKLSNTIKNAQQDDFFDLIIRKTYYKYREKNLLVTDIIIMQDMLKLKTAKTSTKERLAKTLRKLDFQIKNEQQFKLLLEYIQKTIHDRYKILRGDYAYQLLVQKLQQCQKLANSSNSQLSRLDQEKSQYLSNLSNKYNIYQQTSSISSSIPVRANDNDSSFGSKGNKRHGIHDKNMELLLCSNINKPNQCMQVSNKEYQFSVDGQDSQFRIKTSDLKLNSKLNIQSQLKNQHYYSQKYL